MTAPAIEWLLSPWALAVLGLAIGSFLNVVVHRFPLILMRDWLADVAAYLQDEPAMARVLGATTKRCAELARQGAALNIEIDELPALSLSRPRSRCPQCAHQLPWHENLPLLGWLRLGGKCSACGSRISARYPLVELATASLFAAVAWHSGPSVTTVVYCVAVALLIAGALIDLDTTLLPNELTLPLIGLGLVAAWQQWTPLPLADAALGAFFGYFSLWLIAFLFKLVRGVQGMAEGDLMMFSGLGALLGWQVLPATILLASAVGAVVGVSMIVFKGHGRQVPIPFGPYLAGGGIAALFFGPELSGLYFTPEFRAFWSHP